MPTATKCSLVVMVAVICRARTNLRVTESKASVSAEDDAVVNPPTTAAIVITSHKRTSGQGRRRRFSRA